MKKLMLVILLMSAFFVVDANQNDVKSNFSIEQHALDDSIVVTKMEYGIPNIIAIIYAKEVCGNPDQAPDGTWLKTCYNAGTFTIYQAPCYYCVYTPVLTQHF